MAVWVPGGESSGEKKGFRKKAAPEGGHGGFLYRPGGATCTAKAPSNGKVSLRMAFIEERKKRKIESVNLRRRGKPSPALGQPLVSWP